MSEEQYFSFGSGWTVSRPNHLIGSELGHTNVVAMLDFLAVPERSLPPSSFMTLKGHDSLINFLVMWCRHTMMIACLRQVSEGNHPLEPKG